MYLICSGSSRNGKNTLAVSNSVTYDEVYKTEAKTVPHQTTETGELLVYAMSTKAADQDTHNEPSMLYAYARVPYVGKFWSEKNWRIW